MQFKKMSGFVGSVILMALLSATSSAAVIKCGTTAKNMSFGSADSCFYTAGSGSVGTFEALPNPDLDHADYLGGANSSASSLSGVFSLTFTTGGWNTQNASGTWSFLNSTFWNTHTNVWVGFHVGGPSGDGANDFIFEVTDNALSGTWSFVNTTRRGGFSAVHVWADEKPYTPPPTGGDNPPPTKVPEPSSLLLMLLGLVGLRYARRAH